MKIKVTTGESGMVSFEYGNQSNSSFIGEKREVIAEKIVSEEQAEDIVKNSKDYEVKKIKGKNEIVKKPKSKD